jgi:hypothetical protein
MQLILPGLIGMGVAAGAAAVVLIVSGLIGRGDPARDRGRWGPAFALGLGYALGHAAVREWITPPTWPPFPPLDAPDWAAWLALAAMVLGVLDATWPSPAWARWENRLIVSAVTVWLIVRSQYEGLWATRDGARSLGAMVAGVYLLWSVLDGLSARAGRATIFPLVILTAGTSVVLVLSRSLVLGEYGAALTVALAVAWVASRWKARLTLARGGVPIVSVVLAALLLSGYFYAELSRRNALLLASAPLTLLVGELPPIRRASAWKSGLARAIAILIPVGIAIALAAMDSPGLPSTGEE